MAGTFIEHARAGTLAACHFIQHRGWRHLFVGMGVFRRARHRGGFDGPLDGPCGGEQIDALGRDLPRGPPRTAWTSIFGFRRQRVRF